MKNTKISEDVARRLLKFDDDRCPACDATRAEIRETGHRMVDRLGRVATADAANVLPCPEACACLPGHISMEEHRQELCSHERLAAHYSDDTGLRSLRCEGCGVEVEA